MALGTSLLTFACSPYDPLNNLTGVTQGAQTRSYVFDSLGRLTSSATPESGTVGYTYTSFSGIYQRTDARGVVTTYGYDTLNRMNSISYNVGSTGVPATSSVGFTYGAAGASCNAAGRLLSMSDGVGSEGYCYNPMGSLTNLTKVISGTTYSLGYVYNGLENVNAITYPSGRQVVPGYDTIGRVQQVSSSGTNYVSGLNYNAAGEPLGFNYGNGVAASFGYNDHLQIGSLSYTKAGSTLLNLTYGYGTSNNGQIQTITDTRGAAYSTTYTSPSKRSPVFQIVFCKAASNCRIGRSWPILGIQYTSSSISPE